VPLPPTGIPADPILSEHGVEQAQELGVHIAKSVQPRPQQILVSPYYRCLQTAIPTAHALGLPLCVEHGVSEWLGRPSYDVPPNRMYIYLMLFFFLFCRFSYDC
jgi:transcription factor C subunit 7